jgi:hypothetical protein
LNEDSAGKSEEPQDESDHDREPAAGDEGRERDDDGDDAPSESRIPFGIDSDLLRGLAGYRRAMMSFQEQIQPVAEMAARAVKAAEPALRAYNSYMDRVRVDMARMVGPAFESMSRAAAVLDRIDWAALLESMRAALPPNWDADVDLELIGTILNDEGIPLVFVPNKAVLRQLLAAPVRADRVAILVQARDEVLADCQSTLAGVAHSSLAGQLPLAKDAVASCQDGHDPSGQALAVSVVETIVSNILGMNYRQAKQDLVLDFDDLPYTEVRVKAALAPVPKFYTSWYPKSGLPAPVELSRHVSIHQADVQHYTQENALIASMLVASVMKAVDESQHEAQPDPTSG